MKTFAAPGTPSAHQAVLNRAQYFADQAMTHQDLPTNKQQLRSHLRHIRSLGIEGNSGYFQALGATPAEGDKLAKALLKMIADSQRGD